MEDLGWVKIGWWARWGSIGWLTWIPRHLIANVFLQFIIISRKEEIDHRVIHDVFRE